MIDTTSIGYRSPGNEAIEDPWNDGSFARGKHATHHHLTPREQTIRQLLAQRLTNQEISQVLGIGVRTAEHHVGRVIAKLGVADRRAIARAAAKDDPGTAP